MGQRLVKQSRLHSMNTFTCAAEHSTPLEKAVADYLRHIVAVGRDLNFTLRRKIRFRERATAPLPSQLGVKSSGIKNC